MADRGRDILARVSAKSGPRMESTDKVAAHYAAEEPKVTRAAPSFGDRLRALTPNARRVAAQAQYEARLNGPKGLFPKFDERPAAGKTAKPSAKPAVGVGGKVVAAGIGVAHEGQTPRGRRIAKIAGGAGVGAGVLLTAVGAALAYTGGKRSTEPGKDRTDPYTDRLGRNYAQGRKITRE